MSGISYQAILRDTPQEPDAFVPLGETAIATRRREAKKDLSVRISKQQNQWLKSVVEESGDGIDKDAVVRALLDVGTELEIDWPLLAGARSLRDAVRESIHVRRSPDKDD